VLVHPFGYNTASLPWFFIGYWILKRGWVSTRPLLFAGSPDEIGITKQTPDFGKYFSILPSF
jgi:hypothetical protein